MDGLSRLWRRVVVGWAVAVVVGGGLTLWLQDPGEQHEPGATPTPVLRQDSQNSQDTASDCPTPTASPYDDPQTIFVCLKDG
ncbi:hypothetical protein R6V09_14215 [Streptomyces sp. W16]|uniref:hypothetical protein n=1 Tax=Streptomyces sp. W16 TaxID=3076631 RepID=UPI00295B011D|nr:hypothetical protein [Streptomyces sp. W16]MDV9171270.1 hypothetical protein [Streptomyces sp. W16]